MKKIPAHWQILSALLLATLTGLAMRGLFAGAEEGSSAARFAQNALGISSFIGDLFMRALKMIIVPLIVTAVVSGIASLQGVEGFGRLGLKTISFYLGTSLMAVILGLVLVNLIRPGMIELLGICFWREGR